MKLSGGALALLAALAVSCEEASASGGSESIMVCNVFANSIMHCTHHSVILLATYNILYLLCTPILILILSPT